MPRGDEPTSGASGRSALAIFRDEDWEDIVTVVRGLPELARTEGLDRAMAFARTELRSSVSLLDLVPPLNPVDRAAREAMGVFFEPGCVRLLCDPDRAGFEAQTALLEVLHHELFRPSVRAVFERSAPSDRTPYQPIVAK